MHVYKPPAVGGLDRVPVFTAGTGTTRATLFELDGVTPMPGNVLVADTSGNLPSFQCATAPVYVGTSGSRTTWTPNEPGDPTPNAASGAPAVTTVSAAGASQTLSAPTGAETAVYDLTLTAATCTLTLNGGQTGKRCVIEAYLHQDGTGGRTVAWPTSVQWPTGPPPTLSQTPNLTDVVQLVTMDGGTSWLGALVGASYTQQRVPNAPTTPAATGGNTVATVTWTAPANAFPTITNYKVYRGTSSGTETLLTTLGNVTTYTDTGLTNGTTYYYKVSAVNAIGEGALSTEVNATPAVPAGTLPSLQRTVTDGTTTSGSATINSATAAFTSADVGRYIVGTGIPNSSRIGSVTSSTQAALIGPNGSAVTATATGSSVTFTIGLAPVAWFKADALSLADGASVATFTDSSGNGFDATQATGATQPIYKTAILNGKPVLRFNGSQFVVSPFHYRNALAPTTDGTPTSVFVVFKPSASGVIAAPIGGSGAAGAAEIRADADTTVEILVEATHSFQKSAAISTIATAFHVVGAVWGERFSSGTQPYALTVDGTASTGTDPASGTVFSSTASLSIGKAVQAGDTFTGDIAEVLIYNADLTTADRKAVEQSLGAKYAITVAP